MNLNRLILAGVITAALILAAIAGWALGSDSQMYILVGFLIIFGLLTVQYHGYIANGLILATASSAFILPLPGAPTVWELGVLFCASGIVSGLAMKRADAFTTREFRNKRLILSAVVVYCIFLVCLMPSHGVGLNIFGSNVVGGRFYLQQAVLCAFPICAVFYQFNEKVLLRIFAVSCALPVTYLISELLFLYQPAGANYALLFLRLPTDTAQFAEAYNQGFGFRRFQGAAAVGLGLFMAMLTWVGLRKILSLRGVLIFPLALAVLALSALSGSRRVLFAVASITLAIAIVERMLQPKYILSGLGVLVFSLCIVYAIPQILPESVQRTISFLPGIDIENHVRVDANATMYLREELREIAWDLAHEHFWIGRGFGIQSRDLVAFARNQTLQMHVAQGNFYSGPLGILVTLGIGGLILYCLLTLCGLSLCFKTMKQAVSIGADGHPILARAAGIICGTYFSQVVVFLFFTGDAQSVLVGSVPAICGMLAFSCTMGRIVQEPSTAETQAHRQRERAAFPPTRANSFRNVAS